MSVRRPPLPALTCQQPVGTGHAPGKLAAAAPRWRGTLPAPDVGSGWAGTQWVGSEWQAMIGQRQEAALQLPGQSNPINGLGCAALPVLSATTTVGLSFRCCGLSTECSLVLRTQTSSVGQGPPPHPPNQHANLHDDHVADAQHVGGQRARHKQWAQRR
jgi:hypothetical protein